MTICYDTEVAKLVGTNAASLFSGIGFWTNRSMCNQKHFHDGHYWTYNSAKAMCRLYPHLSQKQIELCIKKLKDCGLILVGDYNENRYDHTSWYALTDLGMRYYFKTADISDANNKLIFSDESEGIDTTNQSTRFDQMGESINNNINNNSISINTQIYSPINTQPSVSAEEVERVRLAWNELTTYGISSVTKITPRSDRGKKLKCRVEEYGEEEVIRAIENVKRSKFLCGQNDRMWRITFDWFVLPNNFPKVLDGNYTDPEWKNVISEEEKPKLDPWGRVIEKGWAGRKI